LNHCQAEPTGYILREKNPLGRKALLNLKAKAVVPYICGLSHLA